MKKIKILQFITGLNTGGAEMVVKNLALNIDKKKYEMLVVSILPIGKIGKEIQDNGIRVVSLNAKFKYNPFILWRFFKLLKNERPDIIHSHLFHADIISKLVGKLFKNIIIISTHHNVNIGGKIRNILMRLTKNLVTYNIGVSKMVINKMTKLRIIKKSNSTIIYNGININKFSKKHKIEVRKTLNLETNKNIFLSVGRLHKQKGYIYLIEAVKKIKNDCLFIILGEGEERKFLESKIKENNLENNIILKGNVSNVNDYLQAADFFLMPSLWEGFSVALLEAAASEKIIIASNVGGASEIIEDGKNGFLVKAKNSQEIAEKIDYVLSLSQDKKEEIAKNAKKIVEEKFSVEKMIKEHENLYYKLITSHTN